MKLTELMIGDLVLINNVPHKIQAIDSIDAEVQADDELYYVGEDRQHSEDKLAGIPITRDFYLQNDWECTHETYVQTNHIKDVGKCRLEIVYNKYNTCYTFYVWFDYAPHSRDNGPENAKIPIKYIHDIQHILRLYGLNEFADNFKL